MFDSEEIVLGPLPPGITSAAEGMRKRVWNVLGHTYWMKSGCESTFAFETLDPPGTGVPPHVHPTQDEHIYVLEGVFTLYLDGHWEKAGPGDTVRMPRNLPHAYYNRGDVPTRGLFWVSPAGPAGRAVRQAARPHRSGGGRAPLGRVRRELPPAGVGGGRLTDRPDPPHGADKSVAAPHRCRDDR